MANKVIKPKFDFSGIDPTSIDPDRLNLGTRQQDCALIASTFERGAHYTPTEAAIFSTITRSLQNNKKFALSTKNTLSTYLNSPEDAANKIASKAQEHVSDLVNGSSDQTDIDKQSLNIGKQEYSTFGSDFGTKLLSKARDCIPCDLRLNAFLELHPNIDFLGSLEGFVKTQLSFLTDVSSILNNVDAYSSFCDLLNALSFMCIPDLQRIIALLMALFMLNAPTLDGLIGMLQGLIVPLFAPILSALTSLLDQFSLLVTNPLECVVDAINKQIKKLNIETDTINFNVEMKQQPFEQISNSLGILNAQIAEGINAIKNKISMYTDQVQAMLKEMGGGDSAYLQFKLRALQLTRMISFVTAIITAISKGHVACDPMQPKGNEEIDNFFNNFLNPNSSFNMWLDNDGQIHIDEKIDNFDKIVQELPEFGNIFQFEGDNILKPIITQDTSGSTQGTSSSTQGTSSSTQGTSSSTQGTSRFSSDFVQGTSKFSSNFAQDINKLSRDLATPLQFIVPCRLEVSKSDIDKVNTWIAELSKK